jgi:GT2 family glycosyltransferase
MEHPASVAAAPGLLSIVIKALNEEGKIARAIESALACADEIAPLRLEVVVADSMSEDRTVEVALRFPVRLVRIRDARDRGCGTAVQLGYEWALGDWVYLMDGDMRLVPGFLAEAMQRLQRDDTLAGVGGAVIDDEVANAIDRIRVNNRSGRRIGEQSWLEGGGLYRRSAIQCAGGYAADCNLLGYEEAELGLRLRRAGFRLVRIERQSVSHCGHTGSAWRLMGRRWTSRRAMSAGVFLKIAACAPWRWQALRIFIHPLATGAAWLVLLGGLLLSDVSATTLLTAWATAALAVLLALAIVKRDVVHALCSFVGWHYELAAIVFGCWQPVRPRAGRIAAQLLRLPSEPTTPAR